MKRRFSCKVTLKVRSPFLFPGLNPAAWGQDKAAMRDSRGHPILPQDQIRGVLRHATGDVLLAMNEPDTLRDAMFGRGTGEARAGKADDRFRPARGRVIFSDLVAEENPKRSEAVRVEIDSKTGAAKPGHLVSVELAAPPGAVVKFDGTLVAIATEDEWSVWSDVLEKALTWITAVGSMKSVGFGEVVSASFGAVQSTDLIGAQPNTVPESVTMRLAFDRPLLVDAVRAADNAYRGQARIPGSVIKGALAEKLRNAGHIYDIAGALTALRVGFADISGRSMPLPKSLVSLIDGDRIFLGDAHLMQYGHGLTYRDKSFAFQTDWKSEQFEFAKKTLNISSQKTTRDVRTHVKIEDGAQTAERSALYVEDSINTQAIFWDFQLSYSNVPDAHRRLLHAALLGGLDNIGKTRACAAVTEVDDGAPIDDELTYAVLLETDAVMATPTDAPSAREAYQLYWSRVCPGAELIDFFATQRAAGGYVGRRFGQAGTYSPFWLTEAGSIFFLSGSIGDRLGRLRKAGLPEPEVGGKVTSWETCPFQPQNGYGAIRTDYKPLNLTEGRRAAS